MQKTFNLDFTNSYLPNDYVVTKANLNAYNVIMSWDRTWGCYPYKKFLLLYGMKNSGKTHLAHVWKNQVDATFNNVDITEELRQHSAFIIEDIHLMNPQRLLYLFNLINETNKQCLLTTSLFPIPFVIPDLKSRINSLNIVKIERPDYEMVRQILLRQFQLRSIKVSEAVIQYLCFRLPCDIQRIILAIDLIDKSSLLQRSNITIPFIKKVLQLQSQDDS